MTKVENRGREGTIRFVSLAAVGGLAIRKVGNVAALFLLLGFLSMGSASASGGPLGIDHRIGYDNSGIWNHSVEMGVLDAMIVGEIGCGVWEGGESRHHSHQAGRQ